MPELPEVRTVAKTLKENLINKTVTDIKIIYPKIIETDSIDIHKLIGKKLIDIKTKGKYLIFIFEDLTLISHLRMEGKYFIKKLDEKLEKHEHIIIEIENISLRYHDTRKFGRMLLVKTSEYLKTPCLAKLADEPFDIKYEDLYNQIKDKNIPIKTLLLDQTIINGLGNIYVDEVLFKSKINPESLGKNITVKDCENIVNNSIIILSKAIEFGGTTIRSYTSSLGVTGHYQDYLCVHKQEGKKCEACNETIKKIKVGGRSTYYCPSCQKEVK